MIESFHPKYSESTWRKWRLVYQGGETFLHAYLERFERREEHKDFQRRARMSVIPAFAKSALNDVKNSIYQRTIDINRIGGSLSYQMAMSGADSRGVDLNASSMSFFMGQKILPELLSMGRVGIFVDMPQLPGPTLLDKGNRRPYLYYYTVEDIQNWAPDEEHETPDEFRAIVLRDHIYRYENGLPVAEDIVQRHIYFQDGQVFTKFYGGEFDGQVIPLGINRIPFIMLDIGASLLEDVANHQIALLNLASSDLNFALMSNFPFYTEQFNPASENPFVKALVADTANPNQIKVGINQGRRYPTGAERPGFIAPPTDPLKASMELQYNLKEDIRLLVNLAISNLRPRQASPESRQFENQGLEAGLSYIGLVLQNAEQRIAHYWSLYENSPEPIITYPEEYSLPNPKDISEEIDRDSKLLDRINSITYKKELAKRLIKRTIGSRVSTETLHQMYKEIDESELPYADVDSLTKDIENGLVSTALASELRGYPENQVEQAKKDHAERLALIQAAQTPHPNSGFAAHDTGVQDLNPDPKVGQLEKAAANDTTKDPIPTDKTRGEGRFNGN